MAEKRRPGKGRTKKAIVLLVILAALSLGVFFILTNSKEKSNADPFFETVEKQYFSLFNSVFPNPDGYEFHSLEVYSIRDENIPDRYHYFFHAKYNAYIEMEKEWSEIDDVTFGDSGGIEGFYCLSWDSIEGYEKINERFNRAVKEGEKKVYSLEEIKLLLEQNQP